MISQAGITAGQDYGEGVNLLGFDPDTGTGLGQTGCCTTSNGGVEINDGVDNNC